MFTFPTLGGICYAFVWLDCSEEGVPEVTVEMCNINFAFQ